MTSACLLSSNYTVIKLKRITLKQIYISRHLVVLLFFMLGEKQSKKSIFVFLALIVLVVLVLQQTGCTKHQNDSTKITLRNTQDETALQISDEAAKSFGLNIEPAQVKKVNFILKYNGIVKELPNQSFFVASPVNGRVLKVFAEPNQVVKATQKLADILSQDVAEIEFNVAEEQIGIEGEIEQARLELNLAQSNFERESRLFNDGITAKKDFLEADNRYKRAQNNLEILEKKIEAIKKLSEKRLEILGSRASDPISKAGLAEIRSPVNGIVLKRNINPGEVVEKDKILFETSDLREVFLESYIYEKDLAEIALGEKITFYPEAFPDLIFSGAINYIARTADPNTRTILVKAKIINKDYKLKPEMFGKMLITLASEEALTTSKEAVQKIDNQSVVYIKTNSGYREVKVKVGRESDGIVEILSGLKPNQEVVTKGSFWLKSELHSV